MEIKLSAKQFKLLQSHTIQIQKQSQNILYPQKIIFIQHKINKIPMNKNMSAQNTIQTDTYMNGG